MHNFIGFDSLIEYQDDKTMVEGPFERITCKLPPRKVKQLEPITSDVRDREPEELSENTISKIESLGFSYIDEGQDRAAFESTNCILKVGKSYSSFQNKSEINSWKDKLTTEQKQYFTPVKHHGDESMWLTMPKADTDITNAEWVICVTSIVMDAGIDMIDFNRGNFGRLNGDIVCFDYGTGTPSIDDQPNDDSRYDVLIRVLDSLERGIK